MILRCGYRGSASGVLVEDEKFRTNIKGATAAGLKVGIYFFSQAVNEMEAVEEASLTLSLIKGHKISYPVYIDVEAANGRADGLSAAERTKVVKAFCETVRDSGYTAGVYSNKNWFAEKMDTGAFGNYRIWLAQYTESPTYTGRYEMWQYSSQGTIPGIKGDVGTEHLLSVIPLLLFAPASGRNEFIVGKRSGLWYTKENAVQKKKRRREDENLSCYRRSRIHRF